MSVSNGACHFGMFRPLRTRSGWVVEDFRTGKKYRDQHGGAMTMERAERLAQFLDAQEKRQASDPGLAVIADSTPNLYPEGRARQSLARSLSWPIGIGSIILLAILFSGRVFWLLSRPAVMDKAAGSKEAEQGGIRLIPAVKAILGDAPSPEWEVVKRYALRNSLKPDDIQFVKWFPAKDANPNDSNAFAVGSREDPQVRVKLAELDRLVPTLPFFPPSTRLMGPGPYMGAEAFRRRKEEEQREMETYKEQVKKVNEYNQERNSLLERLYISYKVMTADRVVRVITRTNAPIFGPIRTDDFYYLKDGKVVKSKSGTPADQDELINLYYPGED